MNQEDDHNSVADAIDAALSHALAEVAQRRKFTNDSGTSDDLKAEILRSAAECGVSIDLLPSAFRAPVNKIPV